jgi:hypothetical protein
MWLPLSLWLLSSTDGLWPFEPAHEQVVLGRFDASTPVALGAEASTVRMHGVATETDRGVVATTPTRSGEVRLVDLHSDAHMMRVRLLRGARTDVALWLGSTTTPLNDGVETIEGVGLWVRGEQVQPLQAMRGVVRPAGVAQKMDLPSAVEVLLWCHATRCGVQVVDGVSQRMVAQLQWTGMPDPQGHTMLQWGRDDDDTSVQAWSVGTDQAPSLAMRAVVGGERVLRGSQLQTWKPQMPADLRRLLVTLPGDDWGMITDVAGIERMRRAGIPLQVSTDVPFTWVDAQTRAALARASIPVVGKHAQLDDGYHDNVRVHAVLAHYAAAFPQLARLETLGTTQAGRPVWALKISHRVDVEEAEPSVLLDGGHHGGELLSVEQVLDAVQQLVEGDGKNPTVSSWLEGMAVYAVPLMNPDGNHAYFHLSRDHDRKNTRSVENVSGTDADGGVDLYRNYPIGFGGGGEGPSRSRVTAPRYRGPAAASEPEVQALLALAERERFVASIDYHTAAATVLVPYTDPLLVEPQPNEAWWVAEAIVDRMPVQAGGRRYRAQKNLYPVDGTAQDTLRARYGTVALLVELAVSHPVGRARANRTIAEGRASWQSLLDIVHHWVVRGCVRDEQQRPVEAFLHLRGQQLHSETWSTRPRDGCGFRLPLTKDDNAPTLEFSRNGVTQSVTGVRGANGGNRRVSIELLWQASLEPLKQKHDGNQ